MKSFKTVLLAFILCVFFQISAEAQTKTFINSTGNNLWNVDSNWSPGGVPQSTNDVIIPSGSVVNVSTGTGANALTLEANAVLNIMTGSNFITFGGATYAAGSIINLAGGNFNNYTAAANINGQLNIFGADPKSMTGNFIINNQMNIASGVLDFGYSGNGTTEFLTISPSGVMTVSDASINHYFFGGTLINEGLIQKTSGTGSFTFNNNFKNNNGTVSINSGSIMFSGSTTLTDGIYNISSNGFLELNSLGYHTVVGTLAGQLDGPFIIDGGGILVNNGGTNILNFSGAAGVIWRGGALYAQAAAVTTFLNRGLLNYTGTGSQPLQLAGGVVFRNEGNINFGAAVNNFSIGQSSIFENRELGIINVVDGVNITGQPFINTGLIQKTTGTGSATIRSLTNNSPGILKIGTGNLSFNDQYNGNGTITGAGSISTVAFISIDGTIAPGNSGPGTLNYNIASDFDTTTNCIYKIDINGLTSNTEYDVFAINAPAKLNGIFDIQLGYAPQLNNDFVVITANSISQCNLPAQVTGSFGGTTYTFDVICNPANVTLRVSNVGTLSVADHKLKETSLFPNPTSGNFTIVLGKNYSKISATITNILGQVVAIERFVNTDTLKLNIQGSPGNYFVNITTAEGFSESRKVIKK